MQRHERGVPVSTFWQHRERSLLLVVAFSLQVSFYERVTKDILAFAETFAKGKVVSVLEGGYSDRALISAAMAHVAGFFPEGRTRGQWWQETALLDVSYSSLLCYTRLISDTSDRESDS
jgi:histone deacetylase HOS3